MTTGTTNTVQGDSRSLVRWAFWGLALVVAVVYFIYIRPTPATPPPARTTAPNAQVAKPVRQVVQLPDCSTPCTLDIEEIRDLYTDGEPIFVLPPGWSQEKAIAYTGKGHLVIEGGNIHSGKWKFWSADPQKVVLIRAFVLR